MTAGVFTWSVLNGGLVSPASPALSSVVLQ